MEYWPTTAMPLALKTQVSPASSNPSEFRSPTLLPPERTGTGLTPEMLSLTVTPESGTLPVVETL